MLANGAVANLTGTNTGDQTATTVANVAAGTIAAVTVQGALNELDTEKANIASPTFTGIVTAPTFVGALTGNASTATTVTTNANLTGEVTSVGNAATLTNSAVIGKVLTGYTSAAGTVTAADNILQAIQKVDGNDALKAPLASPTFTGTVTLPTATIAVTQTAGNSSTAIATTAFVDAANSTIFNRTSLASAATPAPVGSSLFNYYTLTAQATAATFGVPTGTPLDGNSLVLKIKASSTEIALNWNAIYRGGTDISLPTITNKTMLLHFMYNTADATWDLVGVTNGI